MITHTIGSDEVGLGPLAGPLVVCATLVPVSWNTKGLRDSKKLTKKKVKEMALKLPELVLDYEFGVIEADELDREGLRPSLRKAHTAAVTKLLGRTQVPRRQIKIVVDGNVEHCPSVEGVIYMVKADTRIPAVQAGAIIAKFERDQVMKTYAIAYPEFGFEENAGYGTEYHLEALKKYGACPIHRRLCAPVRRFE